MFDPKVLESWAGFGSATYWGVKNLDANGAGVADYQGPDAGMTKTYLPPQQPVPTDLYVVTRVFWPQGDHIQLQLSGNWSTHAIEIIGKLTFNIAEVPAHDNPGKTVTVLKSNQVLDLKGTELTGSHVEIHPVLKEGDQYLVGKAFFQPKDQPDARPSVASYWCWPQ